MYDVRSKLGMLFQGGALLDSMTVFDNLAFPLRERTRIGSAEIAARVHETLAAVGLHDADDLLPSQLSGGMIKRAALARAIVMRPRSCSATSRSPASTRSRRGASRRCSSRSTGAST